MQYRVRDLVFVLLFLPGYLYAQSPVSYVEGSFAYAKIVKNFPEFPPTPEPAFVSSVRIARHLDGRQPWHRYYRYPFASLNITAGSMGNNDVLGKFAGVGTQMTFEKQISENWFWAPGLSAGLGWFFKPFDEDNNEDNVVMGSSLAFLVSAETMIGCRMSTNWTILARAGIFHASNSHFKLPNVGMNLPYFGAGMQYRIKEKSPVPAKDTLPFDYNKKPVFNIRLALGMNEQGASTEPVNGPKYPVYLASAFISKMVSPVNKISAGVEAWFNKGSYDYIITQEIYDEREVVRSMAVAIVIGHEFMMGHWSLLATGGIYLYNPLFRKKQELQESVTFKEKLKSYIPARIGMQYYFNNTSFKQRNNLFAGIYIKTNFGQADFLETGLGYLF